MDRFIPAKERKTRKKQKGERKEKRKEKDRKRRGEERKGEDRKRKERKGRRRENPRNLFETCLQLKSLVLGSAYYCGGGLINKEQRLCCLDSFG